MLSKIEALLIDLDGVVYRGDVAIPGAADAIAALEGLGIKHAFVTNNATLTPEQFAEKLGRMGVQAEPADVVTSSEATAEYLRTVAGVHATVSIIGEEGLTHALTSRGFQIDDDRPTYVVVGLDRHITYQRLLSACLAIQRGAQLIATNADRFLPVEAGRAPGAGAILAAVIATTDARPIIVGKPEPTLLRVALDRMGASLEGAAIVGDQIESDIRAGRAAGITTIHLTEALTETVVSPDAEVVPDYTVRDLAELVDRLRDGTLNERRGARPHPNPLPEGEGTPAPEGEGTPARGRTPTEEP